MHKYIRLDNNPDSFLGGKVEKMKADTRIQLERSMKQTITQLIQFIQLLTTKF